MTFRFWTILFLQAIVALSNPFSDDDLAFFNSVHESFCGAENLCGNSSYLANFIISKYKGADELPRPSPEFVNANCCKPCSCDTRTCWDFGDCCPDVLETLPTIEESSKPTRAACERMTLKGVGNTYRVYRLCPYNYLEVTNLTELQIRKETKSKCENPKNYFDFDTRQPVIDTVSRRSYVNKHCAECDSIQETILLNWTPRLFCRNGAVFTQSSTAETIVKDVLDSEYCDIEFLWPEDLPYKSPRCRRVKSECNTTGRWTDYNPVIEAGCHAYRSIYAYYWKNVFCFLCNNAFADVRFCSLRAEDGFEALSFAAVLRFSDEPTPVQTLNVTSKCSETQVYDHFKNVCRELSCTFPRILQDLECVNVGDEVIGPAYRFQLKFMPLQITQDMMLKDLVSMVNMYGQSELVSKWDTWKSLANFSIFYKLKDSQIDQENFTTDVRNNTSSDISVSSDDRNIRNDSQVSTTDLPNQLSSNSTTDSSNVFANFSESPSMMESYGSDSNSSENISDDLKTMINANAVEYILLQIEWNFLHTIGDPHPADFVDSLLKLDNSKIQLPDPNTDASVEFLSTITEYPLDISLYPVDQVTNKSLLSYFVNVTFPKGEVLNRFMPTIEYLTYPLVCPMIQINTYEYDITERPNGIFVKELGELFENKFTKMITEVNETSYSICKRQFLAVTDEYMPSITTIVPGKEGTKPQDILSVVCSCVSILFSLFTFMTYALFSELRTQPGINNMLLCACLIFAQTLFIFGAPQAKYVSKNACAFLGILVHFFWLTVAFAMNICSYHMLRVFIGQSTKDPKTASRLMKTALYTTFCVLSSLLFVVINILVSIFDSEKTGIGYGDGTICYISQQEMVGYTFALPLGVVLVVNVVFFVIVIVKISRLPNVSSSNKKNRNYLKIYVKLSTITGLTWIFGFLFEFTKQVVFEYLFIIFNGGIGVLIFISFVCNRRTYGLYKGKFLMTRQSTRSTEIRSSKVNK